MTLSVPRYFAEVFVYAYFCFIFFLSPFKDVSVNPRCWKPRTGNLFPKTRSSRAFIFLASIYAHSNTREIIVKLD